MIKQGIYGILLTSYPKAGLDLISVIIPAYNVGGYIGRSLDSLCEQSFRDLEIVVVDDGSTDDTLSICSEYSKKDDRIRVIHKDNDGVAAARNTGLDNSHGDLVAFLDADDVYEKDALRNLHDSLIHEGADMAVCGYYEQYSDKIQEHGFCPDKVVYDRIGAYSEYFRMGGCIGSGCWGKLYRAGLFKDVRFKKYKTGEDVEILSRILDKCDRVVCIGSPGYRYIHRNDSATRGGFSKANLDVLYAANDIVELVRRRYPDLYPQACAFHAAWHSAQIQVMYLDKDISVFRNENDYIRNNIKRHLKGYIGNRFISRTDKLFVAAYMMGCYRIVRKIYDKGKL